MIDAFDMSSFIVLEAMGYVAITMLVGWSILWTIDTTQRPAIQQFMLLNITTLVGAATYFALNQIRAADVLDRYYSHTMYLMAITIFCFLLVFSFARSGKRHILGRPVTLVQQLLVPSVLFMYHCVLIYFEVINVYLYTIGITVAVMIQCIFTVNDAKYIDVDLSDDEQHTITTRLKKATYIFPVSAVGLWAVIDTGLHLHSWYTSIQTDVWPMTDFTQYISVEDYGLWVLFFMFTMFNVLLIVHIMQNQVSKITTLTRIDSLTGVLNRPAIMDKIIYEILRFKRGGPSFCLILFDVDHFKKLNDTLGHIGGDTALVFTTSLIKSNLRAIDSLGRYGGEEFLILLPRTNIEQGKLVAEKLRAKLEESPLVIDTPTTITASFGITEFCPEDDLQSVINRADIAMYSAKKTGRNKVCIDSGDMRSLQKI